MKTVVSALADQEKTTNFVMRMSEGHPIHFFYQVRTIGFLPFVFLLLSLSVAHLSAQMYKDEHVEWVLQIGGVGDDVSSKRIAVDTYGDALITGVFKGTIDIGGKKLTSKTADYTDGFIAKVSPSGVIKWVTQISGDKTEKFDSLDITTDNENNVYCVFFSSSNYFTIEGREHASSSFLDAPRIVKLDRDGHYMWCVVDTHQGTTGVNPSDFVRLHTDGAGNLLTGIAGGGNLAIQRALKKYSPSGELLFTYDYPHSGHHWNGDIPRVQGVTTDNSGNIYTAILYNDDVTIRRYVGDTTLVGPFDVAIVKQDPLGEVQWIKSIRGKSKEGINFITIKNEVLYVWGTFGTGAASSDDTVYFADQPMSPHVNNAFVAVFQLDGSLVSVRKLPFNLGISNALGGVGYLSELSNIKADLVGDTAIIQTVGNGLWVASSEQVKKYYASSTYAITNVCGTHYLLGEFSDTLQLDNNKIQLKSRGGKDIYIALLKPESKYVPDVTGLRTPANDSVDVDIPTTLDWWWVGCSIGSRVQVFKESGLTNIHTDTTIQWQHTMSLTNLEHLTKYYWRVRAITADTFGVWSDVRSFTTVKSQPADVVLESPGNQTEGNILNPTLGWKASKRATTYIVDVATDSAFVNKVINGQSVSTLTLDVKLQPNTTYYWRVRAGNSTGTSPWSEVWRFTTRPSKPTASVLVSPSNGASGEVVNPLFVWQAQTPNAGYTLQVARDSAFLFKEVEVNLKETGWRDTLEANTTYYWHVRASNAFESGDWSETWAFNTGTTLPVQDESAAGDVSAKYADGLITLSVQNNTWQHKDVQITLYDLAGRQMLQTQTRIEGSPLKLATPTLPRGIYLITLAPVHGEATQIRMMVE